MSIRGIDVSDYQPNVDWKAVAASGISFAFIKATEGRTFVAELFPSYWEQVKANGLLRGAYHFFRPASDVQGQIDNFLKTVSLEPGDLPPVLDLETTDQVDSQTLCDRAQFWLEQVEQETGFRPIVYTYPGFWQSFKTDQLSDYPLWIAHYTTAEQPIVPGGWKTWLFWQYTDRGLVDGVRGGVDVNLFETVRIGNIGPKVTQLQTALAFRGFEPGKIDGIFGPRTQMSVISLQKSKGLTENGIADLLTWVGLLGPVTSTEPILPEPEPTPNPLPSFNLIDVCNTYQGYPHQDLALIRLQGQLTETVLLEFARRWRNQTTPQTEPIRLIDLGKYYGGLSHQNEALRWLQRQIPWVTWIEFEQQWQQTQGIVTDLQLTEACRIYQDLPNQTKALDWLQAQIPTEVFAEFTQLWQVKS